MQILPWGSSHLLPTCTHVEPAHPSCAIRTAGHAPGSVTKEAQTRGVVANKIKDPLIPSQVLNPTFPPVGTKPLCLFLGHEEGKGYFGTSRNQFLNGVSVGG